MATNVGTAKRVLAALLALSSAAFAQEPRVKAKEPTVVTVEGKAAKVKPESSRSTEGEQPGVLRRTINGIGRGFAAVGHGIAKWVSGNFNDDVVPSKPEGGRTEDEKTR